MLKRFLPFVLMLLWIASPAGAVGLDFVPNVGQAKDGSAFSTEIPGAHVAFRNTSFEYTFAVSRRLVPARMEMIGANPRAAITGTGLLPGIVNVHTATATFSEIPTFGGLRYGSVYPGIDLELDGVAGSLKSTWVVAPNADPARIRWRYHGFDQVGVDREGNLALTLPAQQGEEPRVVTETAPVAWQNVDGQRIPVEVRYQERKDGSLSFEVGAYDETAPLVIDPTLIYNKKLYSLTASGDAIAADAAGNVYLGGATTLGFGYVTKMDSGAVRQWTTYFEEEKQVHDVALGPNNHVYVAGSSFAEGFTAKLANGTGALVYQFANGASGHYSIAVDAQGNSYVAGEGTLIKRNAAGAEVYTAFLPVPHLAAVALDGSNPVVAGSEHGEDVHVFALNAAGTIVQSKIVGGSRYDYPTGIAVDAHGRVFVVGRTASSDFPLVDPVDVWTDQGCEGPCSEGFIIQLSLDLQSLIFSTYFGGSADDAVEDVAVGADGSIHVAGWTGTSADGDFPLIDWIAQPMGGQDVFIAKLALDETVGIYGIEYSTPLGDEDYDTGGRLALSGSDIYVTGQTSFEADPTAFLAKLRDNLLPSGNVVNINFQPEDSEVPEGYLPDSGLPYDKHGNGWSYGWVPFGTEGFPDLVAEELDRNANQQYDTYVGLAKETATLTRWEIGLKPGRYSIRLVAGSPEPAGSVDPSNWTQIYAEGVPFISEWARTSPGQRWLDRTVTVAVTDGKLTLTLDTRTDEWLLALAFLEISAATEPNKPPEVVVTSPLRNEVYNIGRPVTIHARADDSDGRIVKVEFYDTLGAGRRMLLGTDVTAPYSWNWGCPGYGIPCNPGVWAGRHRVEAVATDNEGAVSSHWVDIDVVPLKTQRDEFKVELKIFVPNETADIDIPFLYDGQVAQGDDRDFSSTSQEYRVKQQATLIPRKALSADGVKPGSIANLLGGTVSYDLGSSVNPETGRLTVAARSEPFTVWNKEAPYMVDYGRLAGNPFVMIEPRPSALASEVSFVGVVYDPLLGTNCWLSWNIAVQVDVTIPGAPVARVLGAHEGFPAFEIYIDGEPVFQWKPPAGRPASYVCHDLDEPVNVGPIYLK